MASDLGVLQRDQSLLEELEQRLIEGLHPVEGPLSALDDVTGVEEEDIQVIGDFACSFASSFRDASFIAYLFEGFIADRMPPTCMAPGPALFETCPWVEA